MKKHMVSAVLLLIMMLSLSAQAAEMRVITASPYLTFNENTATCMADCKSTNPSDKVSAHAIATDAMESAISPIVITATEFDAISAQTEHVGRIMLPHTNPEGSNGNSCGEFVANEANVAFSILSAPATESYNVQLYHGTASSGGIPVYLYAKDVPIGSGVWFSNLIVGDTYFFKVSSSTAPVPGSNARYSYKTFSFPTITVSTDVAVDIKN